MEFKWEPTEWKRREQREPLRRNEIEDVALSALAFGCHAKVTIAAEGKDQISDAESI